MKIERTQKRASNWSIRFAWLPTKAVCLKTDKKYYVWLEKYDRYFNYGAVTHYIRKED